ncbi:phytanoyl-CoA dioxygenase family protein [Streptomyces sp. NPDC000345]|uniref:phytanoyl-CoA dioxygenase family protein n=1 Tax=Streptomyces sp. NPDC000345 TaxID=3364537 RepID=UPI00369F7C1F
MSADPPDFGHHVEAFRSHGYAHLRGALGSDELAALKEEVIDGLRRNYPWPPKPPAKASGYDGYYLPLMGATSPVSRSLLNDPRLLHLAERLLERRVLPKPAKGILYQDASAWHRDSADPNLDAVKMVIYFEPLEADSGALRVIPGSHRPDASEALARRRAEQPVGMPLDEEREDREWPGLVLSTEPGDILVFDVHLWHASLHGRGRLQWSVSYVAEPLTAAEQDSARSYIASFLTAGHAYDTVAFPYYDPAWLRPDRPGFADDMDRLGLFGHGGAS